MAFPCQEKDIPCLAPGEGILYRLFPVWNAETFSLHPCSDVTNNVLDIFPGGIVRRQYHQVTVF